MEGDSNFGQVFPSWVKAKFNFNTNILYNNFVINFLK